MAGWRCRCWPTIAQSARPVASRFPPPIECRDEERRPNGEHPDRNPPRTKALVQEAVEPSPLSGERWRLRSQPVHDSKNQQAEANTRPRSRLFRRRERPSPMIMIRLSAPELHWSMAVRDCLQSRAKRLNRTSAQTLIPRTIAARAANGAAASLGPPSQKSRFCISQSNTPRPRQGRGNGVSPT